MFVTHLCCLSSFVGGSRLAERGSDKTSTQVSGADFGEDPVDLCFTSLSKKKKKEQVTGDVRHLTLKVMDALSLVLGAEKQSFAGAP